MSAIDRDSKPRRAKTPGVPIIRQSVISKSNGTVFCPRAPMRFASYLADHVDALSVNTLRARLAATCAVAPETGLCGFDETPHVRKVLKAIAA
ncbi:hypothetical protein [Caballeronia calidae]|uniref:hypothetical protein n=1 Tax=Caballeronia calidae TaxID=1777139 RepID=UPI000AFC4F2B|nr:hypothetical protein [Caballeronia calidae]